MVAIDPAARPSKTQRTIDDPIAEMRDCNSSGDYEGALAMADLILAARPDNLLAHEFRANCCAALEDVYAFRLGALNCIPVVVRLPAQAESPYVDHRTGFVLSLIDGSSTLETIVDASGMPKSDALRILHDLLERGVVGFA